MKAVGKLGAGLVALAILSAPVWAQTASGGRDRVFDALLADPANPELMLQYARLSVAERDYEAAIATLERLLDIAPASQEARYELALAYFALGADDVARYHLDIYRDRGDLTEEEEAAAAAYAAAIDDRENPLSFSGFFEAGLVSRSDADDIGTALDLGLEIDYRLGGANVREWSTLFRLRGFAFPGDSDENQGIFIFRTGPTLSLDGTAFGARLKPYVEYQAIENDDDQDSGRSLSVGLEYTQLLSSGVTLDGTVERGRIDRKDIADDSDFYLVRVGATFRPRPDLSLGISARYLDESFDGVTEDRERYGVRFGLRKSFDGSFLGMENWSVSGFLRYDREDFDGSRSDDLSGAGLSVTSYFRPDAYIRTSLSAFDRSSSIDLFDDSDTVFTLEAGIEF